MIRDLLKWVAPGVVTVVAGTVAALGMATPAMLETLATEGRAALAASGSNWAHVAVDGRRILLSGTTSSDTERDLAIAELLGVRGVGAVDQMVTVAPLASPYRINVAVENGAVSLFGSVPNESLRQKFLQQPGLASVDLKIRSGQPNEHVWQSAVDFALAQATMVETGYFELSGLTLNAVGRARSEKALGRLQMALAELPDGASLGTIAVEPVHVAPYTWHADFDGHRIAISGHVPEARIVDRLRLADVSGVPIATGLSLASGAPDGFAEKTRLLVEQLARLERGEATIVDGVTRLVGVPANVEIAQAVTEALSGTDSIVDLAPPRVSDYWVSINRQPGGTLVFDGFVPDDKTRSTFANLPDADVNFLKFGAGAPEGYQRAVDFGLGLLSHLSEGRFSLAVDAISVSGLAQTPTNYRAVLSMIDADVPQGFTVAQMDVKAPPAASYVFSARRDTSGVITLEGMLPDPAAETALLTMAGASARSRVTFASGEAPNFLSMAQQALHFLPWLRQGAVRYDGTGWSIEGEPLSAIDKGSIETEFSVRGLAQAGWTIALAAPQSAPVQADPYTWSAERLPDGSFLFAGHVPAAALQSSLKVHVGARVADTSRVATGAPEGFAASARAAVDALLALEQGRIAYDGTSWSLSGVASHEAAREAALAAVATLSLPEDAEIAVPPPAPAEPYTWSAEKSVDGMVFDGAVPAESLQNFLAVRAGMPVEDKTVLRDGAPEDFASDVLKALDILAFLSEGRVDYDGAGWTASGKAVSPDVSVMAATLLGTDSPRWTLDLTDPAPPPPQAEDAVPTAVAEDTPMASAEPSIAEPPAVVPYLFEALRAENGAVTLSGAVPAPATARYLAAMTGADAAALAIDPDAPEGFVSNLRAGIQVLLQLRQGELHYSDGGWRLSGEASSQPALTALEGEAARLNGDWVVALTAPSGYAQCEARLAELSAHNAILFQSGAAIIASSAAAELDLFAQALLLCPQAAVEVEGHTDSDGDDQLNLALSVARAEAVVNALIERGVSPSRLYAIGYGESLPVADNATADGKRRNRRIVVSVVAPGDQE